MKHVSPDRCERFSRVAVRLAFASVLPRAAGRVALGRQEVTLSAIGLLFLDEVRTATKLVPFLSRQAWDDCWDNLRQLDDCEPFRFLTRMSSPQMLDKHEHINAGNGLRWLKPGRTTDRYLVSVEGWRLLVWRAIREDQVVVASHNPGFREGQILDVDLPSKPDSTLKL